jgi:hypothetical protein
MIEYRKHKSGRQFFRIDGKIVMMVLSKYASHGASISEDLLYSQAILQDKEMYLPSTEQEFKEALETALDRIQKMKV